jgi:DNA-directed RNA polymerase subunit RPC12/RpoP
MHYYKTLVQETSKQHKHKSNKNHSSKGAVVLKCLECNKEFSSILGLQTHQRHHKHTSGTSKKVYTCNECGKEFGMPRNLSVHMRSHHEDHSGEERASEGMNIVTEELYQSEGNKPGSPHACSLCHKGFPDADTLGAHITLQHFRCPQCGEAFVRQRHVTDHIRKMHSVEEGQYVTGECVSTEINEREMQEEPPTVKEENEDENIDVSTVTPTADQQYVGSPNHRALSEHGEQLESYVTNTKSNDTSQSHIHSPSSPNAAQQSHSTNDDNDDDGDDVDDDDDDDDDDGTSLSPTPPTEGDNGH